MYLEIPARDGFLLAATLYADAAPSRQVRVVLVNSATGVKRSFYDKYARFLAESGFTVITFDYRGIGDSRPSTLNKFKAFMHEWGEKDIAGVIDWIGQRYAGAKLLVVGHSVGGQVMGLAQNNTRVSAMLLVASQSGYWRLWPRPSRYLVFIFWYAVIPVLAGLFSYLPSRFLGLGEDLPAGVAFEWASWGRDPKHVLGKNLLQTKECFNNYTSPVLAYSVANDFLAPPATVDALMTFYPNAQKTRKHITPQNLNVRHFGHFDFFREQFKESLWQESVSWLKAQSES